jgi:(p)ppGpp synthase/HD superfamily hydrolase
MFSCSCCHCCEGRAGGFLVAPMAGLTIAKRAVHPIFRHRGKVIPSKIDPVLVIQAANVAAKWHAAQRRKGARQEPYVNHLLEVAELVAAGGGDQQAIIAALPHDAIEDQKISPDTIAEQFSEQVARIVLEVTDDKLLPWQERKAAQIATASGKSHSGKLIDKISNVRSYICGRAKR